MDGQRVHPFSIYLGMRKVVIRRFESDTRDYEMHFIAVARDSILLILHGSTVQWEPKPISKQRLCVDIGLLLNGMAPAACKVAATATSAYGRSPVSQVRHHHSYSAQGVKNSHP